MKQPCGWEATPCEECCDEALDGLNPDLKDALAAQAVQILWAATGKQYGLCDTVLRPCRRSCGSFWGGLPWPTRLGGEWVNLTCNTCTGGCGCTAISEFIAEDTDSILGVVIDGEQLDPLDTVVVYDNRRIVRVDGGSWPTCQDLGAPLTDAGTWGVRILRGQPVPAGGEVMAGLLLCELAKACSGDEECRLPRRVQQITRQGVSISFADQFEALGNGLTGLWEVDAWITAARAKNNTYSITSPDTPRPWVQTWPTENDWPSE